MKIVLVQNFLLDSSGLPADDNLYPHLGLISLIAEIEKSRHLPDLYDPMLQLHKGQLQLDGSIYGDVASQLLEGQPAAVGFTALGCNFMAVVKIAREIKRRRPKTFVLLGGPHPTVLETEIMTHFSDFDILVRGEAEQTIVPLLDALDDEADLSTVPGISYREGPRVCRSVIDGGLMDVDQLSMGAFHFYPVGELGLKSMRVEAGRGCPFHCTFCSTATFFGRKYRVKAATKLVSELKSLNSCYQISDFSLQHDLFTVNRKKVLQFCEEVRPCSFSWTCSARIDCVDPELLSEMARSGCRGIYFGIETGSASLQELVKKRLNINILHPTLTYAKQVGLNVTTSFITGFPEETFSDLKATVDCLESCLRISPSMTCLQLHLLTPEPGTALYEEYKTRLLYDGHISDFNFPPLASDESELLRDNPDVFMNHHFYPTKLPRSTIIGVTSIFPRLCGLGGPLLQATIDFLETTLSGLIFEILARCDNRRINNRQVFRHLLALINRKGADGQVLRQLIEFAFAHLRALQVTPASNSPMTSNGEDPFIRMSKGTTLFKGTFDIPAVFDEIQDPVALHPTTETRGTMHNFVVYREPGNCRSKTLRVGDGVATVLHLLTDLRRKGWILEQFPVADAEATSGAIDDLLGRGVLQPARAPHKKARGTAGRYLIATGLADSSTSWSKRASLRRESQ